MSPDEHGKDEGVRRARNACHHGPILHGQRTDQESRTEGRCTSSSHAPPLMRTVVAVLIFATLAPSGRASTPESRLRSEWWDIYSWTAELYIGIACGLSRGDRCRSVAQEARFPHVDLREAIGMSRFSPGTANAPRNERERGKRTVVEAIRDQWVIVVGVLVLVALVSWLVAGRSRWGCSCTRPIFPPRPVPRSGPPSKRNGRDAGESLC